MLKLKWLIFLLIISLQLNGQDCRYFDAGNGSNYEMYIAYKALNCISKNCISDFSRNDFAPDLIVDDTLFQDLHEISVLVKNSKVRRKYMGFYQVDESFLTFTRTMYSPVDFKFFYQIELKLKYVDAILNISSIVINKKSNIREYLVCENCGDYSIMEHQGKRDIYGPGYYFPPPPPVKYPFVDYQFRDLSSKPQLCVCQETPLKIDDRRYQHKRKIFNYSYIYQIDDENNSGYYIAKKNSGYGIIDSNNNILVPFKYEYIRQFRNDLMRVQLNGKHGIVTISNELIIPIKYDDIKYNYINNKSKLNKHHFGYRVRLNNKEGILSSSGKEVIPIIYNVLRPRIVQNKYFYIVALNNKSGIINDKGEVLTNLKYDRIQTLRKLFFELKLGDKKLLMVPKNGKLKKVKIFYDEE